VVSSSLQSASRLNRNNLFRLRIFHFCLTVHFTANLNRLGLSKSVAALDVYTFI
jgi:hypothetical protein